MASEGHTRSEQLNALTAAMAVAIAEAAGNHRGNAAIIASSVILTLTKSIEDVIDGETSEARAKAAADFMESIGCGKADG
jgi:hypothetical protein